MIDIPEDLRRHGWPARFQPDVESAYSAWLVDQVVPLVRVTSLIALPVWIFVPIGIRIFNPDQATATTWSICWANAALLAIMLTIVGRLEMRLLVPIGVLNVLVIASDHMYLFASGDYESGPALIATIALFWMFLGPLMRMPFLVSVPVGILILGVALAFLTHDLRTGRIDGSDTWPFFTVLGAAMLIVFGASLVTEKLTRAKYVDEQVIRRQQALIRRYVPSAVASRIDDGDTTVDHPQRRKVTVFFSDVVGFTALADRVDPEALAEIVNDYLGELSELIERHGGTLNEFAGDGVMAIFGAPDELDPADQVRAALAAAQELQRSLPTWSESWYQHGIIEDAKARVGINTGTVSVGTFGSQIRATYTGIGLQTNIAARVQAEAEPGGILLSNTSWHLVKDSVMCRPHGEVMVKGVHFPIELYEPVET